MNRKSVLKKYNNKKILLEINPCRQESLHPKRLPNEFNKIIQWKTGRFQNLSISAEDVQRCQSKWFSLIC